MMKSSNIQEQLFHTKEEELLFFDDVFENWEKKPKIQSFIKRSFDICFSLFALVFFSPFFLFIALTIRFFSPGKVIFSHDRLGFRGKVFKCYKFRTMHENAEMILENILKSRPGLRQEWDLSQKLKEDPRIFPFGKILRKYSLDELPQFFNVLKGDLSVVGPRPYTVAQKKELGLYANKILSVRPGITGLWQTSGRSKKTFKERILLDYTYLEKRSLLFDLFLILKTVPCMLFSKDAY